MNAMTPTRRLGSIVSALAIAAAATPAQAQPSAAELTVEVTGVREERGEIGCALFSRAEGFPGDTRLAQRLWSPAREGAVRCVFSSVSPGLYAVAVVHDLNGNRRLDANLLGMPKEPWGVSRNVVPGLRAPTLEEARFEMTTSPLRLQIALVR